MLRPEKLTSFIVQFLIAKLLCNILGADDWPYCTYSNGMHAKGVLVVCMVPDDHHVSVERNWEIQRMKKWTDYCYLVFGDL